MERADSFRLRVCDFIIEVVQCGGLWFQMFVDLNANSTSYELCVLGEFALHHKLQFHNCENDTNDDDDDDSKYLYYCEDQHISI